MYQSMTAKQTTVNCSGDSFRIGKKTKAFLKGHFFPVNSSPVIYEVLFSVKEKGLV